MIYSRFGTKLTLLSKQQDRSGGVSIQANAEGTANVLQYLAGDLTADDGAVEIDAVLAKLPWKVVQKKVKRF